MGRINCTMRNRDDLNPIKENPTAQHRPEGPDLSHAPA